MNRSPSEGAIFFVAGGIVFAVLGAWFAVTFWNSFYLGNEHDPDDLTWLGASAAFAAYGVAHVASGVARARRWSRSEVAMEIISRLDVAIAFLSCALLLASGIVFHPAGALLTAGSAYLGFRHLLLIASLESEAQFRRAERESTGRGIEMAQWVRWSAGRWD